MRALVGSAAAAVLIPACAAGAWPQEEDHGLVITQAGIAYPEIGDTRFLNEGYSEWGLGDSFTAVMTFDSVVEPEQSQTIWHGTLGVRYSYRFEALPDVVFGVEPRFGYQTHESVVVDPVFAGDGWSYGIRVDAGTDFEIWDRHAFANLGASAATRSQADGEYKLELVAGIDLFEEWQVSAGYFGTVAPGALTEPGAYSKHEVGLTVAWRMGPDESLAASVMQTVAADRTAPETAIRLAIWTRLAPEPDS